jgi:hypothetical protein
VRHERCNVQTFKQGVTRETPAARRRRQSHAPPDRRSPPLHDSTTPIAGDPVEGSIC